ncbi:MAG: hypothetical protein QOH98_778 [Methylobacteriaceae bacterium]|jgi:hypothetical protein|nr:hypothetical protein [Methylobacteriaceae bacterium]
MRRCRILRNSSALPDGDGTPTVRHVAAFPAGI